MAKGPKLISCSLCNKRFYSRKAVADHGRDFHPDRASEVRSLSPKERGETMPVREPSMASVFIEGEINRAMGVANPDWLEDMLQ